MLAEKSGVDRIKQATVSVSNGLAPLYTNCLQTPRGQAEG